MSGSFGTSWGGGRFVNFYQNHKISPIKSTLKYSRAQYSVQFSLN